MIKEALLERRQSKTAAYVNKTNKKVESTGSVTMRLIRKRALLSTYGDLADSDKEV